MKGDTWILIGALWTLLTVVVFVVVAALHCSGKEERERREHERRIEQYDERTRAFLKAVDGAKEWRLWWE